MKHFLITAALSAALILGAIDVWAHVTHTMPTLSAEITAFDAKHPWTKALAALVLMLFWWHLFGPNVWKNGK